MEEWDQETVQQQSLAQLEEFARSAEPQIQQLSQQVMAMWAEVAEGRCSEDEFCELVRDMARTAEMQVQTDNIETKTMLIMALSGAAKLV